MDFYLPAEKLLIQVSHDVSSPDTLSRETRAIQDALAELPKHHALLITGLPLGRTARLPLSIQHIQAWEWALA